MNSIRYEATKLSAEGPRAASQRGAVLVVALILLGIMTLLGVITMQRSVVEHKSATNTALKSMALQSSEAPRPYAGDVVDEHTYERGWTGVTLPTGFTVANVDGSDNPNSMFQGNEAGEDILAAPPVLKRDFDYLRNPSGGGTGSATDLTGNIVARVYAYKSGVIGLPGSSAAMVAGYEGTGKAMAASGSAMIFSMRSDGFSAGGARASTESDYRILIRN